MQTRVEHNPLNRFSIEKQLYLYKQTRDYSDYRKRIENEYRSRRGLGNGSKDQYIEQRLEENVNSKKKQLIDKLNSIRKQILIQFEKAGKNRLEYL
jgi:hypothetical protein